MPKITYIQHDGQEHTLDAEVGQSLMQVAVDAGLEGIQGDCGGCCSCATCQGVIAEQWSSCISEAMPEENEMREGAFNVMEGGRLTCQIFVTSEMDGLVVNLPELQG